MSTFSDFIKTKKRQIWQGDLQKTYRQLQHLHSRYPVVNDELKEKINEVRNEFAVKYSEREKAFNALMEKEQEKIKDLRIEYMRKEINLIKEN